MKTLYSTPAEVGDAIKAELKRKFPGVDFTLRNGTGWAHNNFFHVCWHDGPAFNAVYKVVYKYKHSWHMKETHVVAEDGEIMKLGGVNSVHCDRYYSSELRDKCLVVAEAAGLLGPSNDPHNAGAKKIFSQMLHYSDLRGVSTPSLEFDEANRTWVFVAAASARPSGV